MNRRSALLTLFFGMAACALRRSSNSAQSRFSAFSLREAQKAIQQGVPDAGEISSLGRMTRMLGAVHDPLSSDVILVGSVKTSTGEIALHDFIAALRAISIEKTWPLVSIDKTTDTPVTKLQHVRLEGVRRTDPFAAQLYVADLTLKKAALGVLRSGAQLPAPSYFDLCREAAAHGGWNGRVSSRLWFYAAEPSLLVRDDVIAIRALRVGVRAETAFMSAGRDEIAERYAAALSTHLESIAATLPEIRPLPNLYALVAIAKGIESFRGASLDYWLRDYPMPLASVPETCPVLRREERIVSQNQILELEGGIDMRTMAGQLHRGDHVAFREAVLKSRPQPDSLTWPVPLQGWRFAGDPEAPEHELASPVPMGTFLERRMFPVTGASPTDVRGGVNADVQIRPEDFLGGNHE